MLSFGDRVRTNNRALIHPLEGVRLRALLKLE
jgi:hypothetical protein